MRTTFNFWAECTKIAARDSVAIANDWQWLIGFPALAAILVVVKRAFAGGISVVIDQNTALGALEAAGAAFVITWTVAFVVRLLHAPVVLFNAETAQVDELTATCAALRLRADHTQALRDQTDELRRSREQRERELDPVHQVFRAKQIQAYEAAMSAAPKTPYTSLRESAIELYGEIRGTYLAETIEAKADQREDDILNFAAELLASQIRLEVRKPPSAKWERFDTSRLSEMMFCDGARGIRYIGGHDQKAYFTDVRLLSADLSGAIRTIKGLANDRGPSAIVQPYIAKPPTPLDESSVFAFVRSSPLVKTLNAAIASDANKRLADRYEGAHCQSDFALALGIKTIPALEAALREHEKLIPRMAAYCEPQGDVPAAFCLEMLFYILAAQRGEPEFQSIANSLKHSAFDRGFVKGVVEAYNQISQYQ